MRHQNDAYSSSQAALVGEATYGKRSFLSATNDGFVDVRKFGLKAIQVIWIKDIAVVGLGTARAATTPILNARPRIGYSSIPTPKIGSSVRAKLAYEFIEVVASLALCRTWRTRLLLMTTRTGEHEREFGGISDFEVDRVRQWHG